MPIRIMHVVDHLGNGGLENAMANLIEHMDPARFEHVVYAVRKLGPIAERLAKSQIRVVCHRKRESDSRIQIAALARAIREIRPDIVHSRNWGAVEAVVAARWVGSPAVVHSEHGLEAGADVREPRRRIWFRRLVYELAHRVMSVSYHLRDLHARRTGFSAQRITVIHNSVNQERFAPDAAARASVRKELAIGEDEFCIGCVGNFFPVKDHMTALRALEGLDAERIRWRLLLMGDGPERAKLESFAAAHPGWKQRVTFLGASGRVPELLNGLDVYVLPSISEGISNSLLEAMATALPVVATATGGNPEVVVHGDSGILFPVGDAARLAGELRLLRASEERRRELGPGALRRVREEFSMESMVGKYTELYESLSQRAAMPVPAAAEI
jgi:sugar transferase (PEP-CTERM/EpsH1 system associated)